MYIYVYMYTCTYICLSVYLSICLPTYLSIYLSIDLSIYLSSYLPTYRSFYLSTYLPIYLNLSVDLSIYLSTYLPTYRSFYLSIYLSILIYLSIFLSFYLSIYLSTYLSISSDSLILNYHRRMKRCKESHGWLNSPQNWARTLVGRHTNITADSLTLLLSHFLIFNAYVIRFGTPHIPHSCCGDWRSISMDWHSFWQSQKSTGRVSRVFKFDSE